MEEHDLEKNSDNNNIEKRILLPFCSEEWTQIKQFVDTIKKVEQGTCDDASVEVLASLLNENNNDENINYVKVSQRQVLKHILHEAATFLENLPKAKPFIPLIKFEEGRPGTRTISSSLALGLSSYFFLSLLFNKSKDEETVSFLPHLKLSRNDALKSFVHLLSQNSNFQKHNVRFEKLILTADEIMRKDHILTDNYCCKISKIIVCHVNDVENYQQIFPCDVGTKNVPEEISEDIWKFIPALKIFDLFGTQLSSEEDCLRISSPQFGNLCLVNSPFKLNSKESILAALNAIILSLKPCSGLSRTNSILRPPSVEAVTSYDSDLSESAKDEDSNFDLSLSDSCAHKRTDSECSYRLSNEDMEDKYNDNFNENKLKRKDTFEERLKAALERGNTPDESDYSSTGFVAQNSMKMGREDSVKIRKQKSSGFQVFHDDFAESDTFFTPTEDDISFPESSKSPYMLKKKEPQLPNRGLRSRKTWRMSSSSFYTGKEKSSLLGRAPSLDSLEMSDSSSYSSEGLGMPKLKSECMEDLCERLETVIYTQESRDLQLRRTLAGMPLLRSLSDSFIDNIQDLDKVPYLRASQTSKISTQLSLSLPQVSLSSLDLCPKQEHGQTSSTSNLKVPIFIRTMKNFKEDQILFLLYLISVSILSIENPKITLALSSQSDIFPFQQLSDHLLETGTTTNSLLLYILEFVETQNMRQDVFTHVFNKNKK